jgi:hypothetical protein
MAALAICAVTATLLRRRTDTRAPAPVRPDQPPPANPGMIRSPFPRQDACSPIRRRPAPPDTGRTGAAVTKPSQPGTTSAPGSPGTSESPRSASEWLLPY